MHAMKSVEEESGRELHLFLLDRDEQLASSPSQLTPREKTFVPLNKRVDGRHCWCGC